MSMVVRTNMNSMNANRNLSINNSYVAKSIEKLASGFQINRASDDASGLAISEKMQAQITGLDQGTDNALEGIGLVQTAEGAMSEIHDMLNRIVELSTKSANGTIQDEVDREAIQAEVDVLVDEIDRIAQSTNYNGIDLLNGNLSDGGLVIRTSIDTGIITNRTEMVDTTDTLPVVYNSYNLVNGVDFTGLKGSDLIGCSMVITSYWGDVCTINFEDGGSGFYEKYYSGGDTYNSYGLNPNGEYTFYLDPDADVIDNLPIFAIYGGTIGEYSNADTYWYYSFHPTWVADGTDSKDYENLGYVIVAASNNTDTIAPSYTTANHNHAPISVVIEYPTIEEQQLPDIEGLLTSTEVYNGDGLILHVADQNQSYNKIEVNIDSMRADALCISNLNVSNQESAGAAIDIVKDAINYVSTNRCNVGALQNRLERTINNNNNTSENMTSAKSAIKDTDMAKEMMEYTKMNVLTEASQAMLAQSNQAIQQILSLLG